MEQDFNSPDAQHEACAAYIASQKHEGWVQVVERYDDGGISGGTLERPSLQRLLADIDRGAVDQINGLQDRPADTLFGRLLQDSRRPGCSESLVCVCNPIVQHYDQHGSLNAEHAFELCSV